MSKLENKPFVTTAEQHSASPVWENIDIQSDALNLAKIQFTNALNLGKVL